MTNRSNADTAPYHGLSLAHLWTFTHVAQTGSVTQSAAMLFRTQSAVTRAIQILESEVGEPLFERRPSGMLLTPVGHCALARARRVFFELDALARWCAAQGARAFPKGSVPAYLMNTRRLDLLVALARTQHMPTAAASVGITQSAVSGAVKVLEAGAGLSLFQRSGRGIVQTPHGQAFVLHVRRALNELRLVRDDIAALQGNLRGTVVIGAPPLARTLILPKAIAGVSAAFPGIRICTNESPYEILMAELRAGDLDFILGALPPEQEAPGLINELLFYDDLVVVARKNHPLAARANLSMKALQTARWILPRSHTPARPVIDELFRREHLPPPAPTVESVDTTVLRGTLVHSDMIAAVSAQQLHLEILSGELVVLDVRMSGTQRAIGLRRREGAPAPAAQAMMEAIRKIVVEMGLG
ncbi:LysR family transcriptional regulator [Oxalobacteraceae bacterium CAVE-383]|nr:LysR family transcriptional regulator [Oxalobacteraceae bacterium CAVE-383]